MQLRAEKDTESSKAPLSNLAFTPENHYTTFRCNRNFKLF